MWNEKSESPTILKGNEKTQRTEREKRLIKSAIKRRKEIIITNIVTGSEKREGGQILVIRKSYLEVYKSVFMILKFMENRFFLVYRKYFYQLQFHVRRIPFNQVVFCDYV